MLAMWRFGFTIWSEQVGQHVGAGARVIRALPCDLRDAARAPWLAAVVPPTCLCLAMVAARAFLLSLRVPNDLSTGVPFGPLPLFVLWGIALAAAAVCMGLMGMIGAR